MKQAPSDNARVGYRRRMRQATDIIAVATEQAGLFGGRGVPRPIGA